MAPEAGWYADPQDPARVRWWDGANWTAQVAPAATPIATPPPTPTSGLEATANALAQLNAQIEALTKERDHLQSQIVETRDVFLLQEVGLYQYSHPLDSSIEYKDALAQLDREMTAAVKAGTAVTGTTKWAINGSEKEGAKMVADFCKLMLRAYNNEADNLVRTMKAYSLKAGIERLEKMRVSISKLGAA